MTAADLWPFPDVAQAILALRREWISGRFVNSHHRPAVFIDGVLTPGAEALAGLSTSYVLEIRYLTALEAYSRYGVGHVAGAIMVITRRSGSSR